LQTNFQLKETHFKHGHHNEMIIATDAEARPKSLSSSLTRAWQTLPLFPHQKRAPFDEAQLSARHSARHSNTLQLRLRGAPTLERGPHLSCAAGPPVLPAGRRPGRLRKCSSKGALRVGSEVPPSSRSAPRPLGPIDRPRRLHPQLSQLARTPTRPPRPPTRHSSPEIHTVALPPLHSAASEAALLFQAAPIHVRPEPSLSLLAAGFSPPSWLISGLAFVPAGCSRAHFCSPSVTLVVRKRHCRSLAAGAAAANERAPMLFEPPGGRSIFLKVGRNLHKSRRAKFAGSGAAFLASRQRPARRLSAPKVPQSGPKWSPRRQH